MHQPLTTRTQDVCGSTKWVRLMQLFIVATGVLWFFMPQPPWMINLHSFKNEEAESENQRKRRLLISRGARERRTTGRVRPR